MRIELLNRIRQNQNNIKFLRENSHWYKYLNRNPIYFKQFEEEMKKQYKLTTEDKINKMIERLDMVSKIMDILN